MKYNTFDRLSILRDKDWVPRWLRWIIDYIRYEWLWTEHKSN
jgi:hypothetical protein